MTHDTNTHVHDPDPPAGVVYWTDERTARLRELHAGGLKFHEIGSELGLTKSAIAGKMRRLGLASPRPRLTEEEKEARLAKQRDRDAAKKRRKRGGKPERRPLLKLIRMNGNSNGMRLLQTITGVGGNFREADIIPHNVTLYELTDHDCRYPYGDGPIMFCGHPRQERSSYCPAHHALCWVPAIRRQAVAA